MASKKVMIGLKSCFCYAEKKYSIKTSMRLTIRPIYAYLLTFCLFMLAVSFILQFHFQLEPCPLCVIDRIIVLILTFFFAIGFWHNPAKLGQKIYSVGGFIFCAIGIAVCARHVWLLHLPPDQVPACSPGFDYLIDTLPLHEALIVIFKGTGECAGKSHFSFGLSLPMWTMIGFIILAVGNVLVWWGNKK